MHPDYWSWITDSKFKMAHPLCVGPKGCLTSGSAFYGPQCMRRSCSHSALRLYTGMTLSSRKGFHKSLCILIQSNNGLYLQLDSFIEALFIVYGEENDIDNLILIDTWFNCNKLSVFFIAVFLTQCVTYLRFTVTNQ